ncbi:DUF6875 domain-containing protein [Herbidospora mongoliensis]|uniref:DUF6875 domain-containing protein n=1 Tax=Herbidospora mongoliensis TaxID=688067 RepID=UPI000A446E29|nr:hypothetical protein [Herbidospora mongoliensis]
MPLIADSLIDAGRAHTLFDRFPGYAAALDWVRDFVGRRDPRIMRPGAVCPRVGNALRTNMVRLVSAHTPASSLEEAKETGLALIDLFHHQFRTPQEHRAGALLCLFPELDPERAGGFIDEGHRLLRMDFVRRGLMLGEFHPESRVASVHNPDFVVMRSPVPMFAVRALSLHDLLFLDTPAHPAAVRAEYLTWYLHYLDNQLGEESRRRVAARLDALSPER